MASANAGNASLDMREHREHPVARRLRPGARIGPRI